MADFDDLTWSEYKEAMRAQARERGIPLFGTFELTPLCNFNCKMCYVHLTEKRMRELGRLRSADEWVEMACQARELGTLRITLTGGEVLSRSDFGDIYSGIQDLGILVAVLSNGSLINEEIIDLFKRRPPSLLRVTLYGSTNETYERLCGIENGFDIVFNNLKRLREAKVDFMLSFTETKLNIDDSEDVFRIADSFGVPIVVGSELVQAVRGASSLADELRVNTPALPDEKKRQYSFDDFSSRFRRPGLSASPFSKCKAYRSSFWLDWNGDMEMCSFMSSIRTKPFEWGMERAWNELLAGLDRITLPDACLGCELRRFCSSCPGIREAETGSAELVCGRYCERAELMSKHVQEMGVVL